MKKYELIAKQLKLTEFLNKRLSESSSEYLDIRNHVKGLEKKETEEEARQYLYKTGKGYYELARTDNSFNHCKRTLIKDGIEEEKVEDIICGAVILSLMDYVRKQEGDLVKKHHKALEKILDPEYAIYLCD
jgi:hypothetical protein